MKQHLAMACAATLLIGSVTSAQRPESPSPTAAQKTEPAKGGPMVCRADAERARTPASADDAAGPEASRDGLAGLEARIARLERMLATETPVCTMTTTEGLVRVYRDGTVVTDSGGSRSFEQPDSPARAHRSRPGARRTPRPGGSDRRSPP